MRVTTTFRGGSCLFALLACLAGCVHAPAVAQKIDTVASLKMPPGADYERTRLLKQGRMAKVYVDVLKMDGTLQFPAELGKVLEVSPAGLTRLFTDTILKSRRFEVYDLRSTVTADQADVLIDAQILAATQVLKPLEGDMQAAYTSVLLSVQAKDISKGNGKYLFGNAVQVEGKTGLVSGDRTVLSPRDNPNDPAIRLKLAGDYQLALRRAFILAGQRLESILRPQAAVLAVEGNEIGVMGGQQHGFQEGDEMVIFRGKVARLEAGEQFGFTKAIALVHCDGVGTTTSQCVIRSKVGDVQIQEGDFGVITDESLRKTRWE